MSLREKAIQMNAGTGIPFMEGREKMELPIGSTVNIVDFGFIMGKDDNGADHEYVVLDLAEFPNHFSFGGGIITANMKEFDNAEDRAEIKKGLPVVFEKKKNKAGKRTYTKATFFPDEMEG